MKRAVLDVRFKTRHHCGNPGERMIDWNAISAYARANKVAAGTVRTWKRRGIAHKHRIGIITASAGTVTLAQILAHDRAIARRRAGRA